MVRSGSSGSDAAGRPGIAGGSPPSSSVISGLRSFPPKSGLYTSVTTGAGFGGWAAGAPITFWRYSCALMLTKPPAFSACRGAAACCGAGPTAGRSAERPLFAAGFSSGSKRHSPVPGAASACFTALYTASNTSPSRAKRTSVLAGCTFTSTRSAGISKHRMPPGNLPCISVPL